MQLACSVLFLPNEIPFAFGTKFLPQLDHTVHKIHYVFTAVTVFPQSIHYIYLCHSQEEILFSPEQPMWILKSEQRRVLVLYTKLTTLYISLHKTQMATTSVVCQHHWLSKSRPSSCQTLCYTSTKSDVVPPQRIIPHKGIFSVGIMVCWCPTLGSLPLRNRIKSVPGHT